MSTSSNTLIDAHLHLWDRHRFDYPWMAALPDLPHTSLPQDLAGLLDGAVVVEAGIRTDQTSAEVAWLTELSERFPLIRGIVAAVDLTDGRLGEVLAELSGQPVVVGVRDNFEGRAPGDLDLGSSTTAQTLRNGILAVLEAGLTFDICVRSAQLPELTGLLASIVEARGSASGLVLDHLGKPLPDGPLGDRTAWSESLARFSELPGLHVKFSGLPGQVPGDIGPERARELVRAYSVVVDLFGAERTMFGTDHPVSTVGHGLTATDWVTAATAEFAARRSPEQIAAITGRTAIAFYGLRSRT